MWYQLRRKRWSRRYFTTVTKPTKKRSHGEIRPDGRSVSPTICQCYIAFPAQTTNISKLYVHEVDVISPDPITEANNVLDYKATQEHVITKESLGR